MLDSWGNGVGPDDTDGQPPLFAELARLARGERAQNLPAPDDAAELVLHAAVETLDGLVARDRAAVERGVGTIADALAALTDDHPHAGAARAWADLALGEVALAVGDARVALHRFEAVALPASSPIVLRVRAMHRLVDLAVERLDLEAARTWSARALAACELADRPILAARSRRYELALAYATGDVDTATRANAELDADTAQLGALLLATTGDDAALAALLERARAARDTLLFALCMVVAARRALAADRLDVATALVEDGVRYLYDTAPHLVRILKTTLEVPVDARIS